jgi:ribosome maturation factor RimP
VENRPVFGLIGFLGVFPHPGNHNGSWGGLTASLFFVATLGIQVIKQLSRNEYMDGVTPSAAGAQTELAARLRALAEPLAAGLGLRLWGVELLYGGRPLARVYVERQSNAAAGPAPTEGSPSAPDSEVALAAKLEPDGLVAGQGVSIDQCAELSRLLGLSLDVEDIMPGAYVLEVSSPGLDRLFFTAEQLAGAVGKPVELHLLRPLADFPGRRHFRGTLVGAPADTGELFTLQAEDCPKPGESSPVSFAFSQVKKIRQVYVPPDKTPPGKKPGKGKKSGQAVS